MHFQLAEAQKQSTTLLTNGHVELTLFGWRISVGLEPIEGGKANLCLVVTKRHFAMNMEKTGTGLLHAILKATPSRLAERLAGAEACWPRPPCLFLEFPTASFTGHLWNNRRGFIGWAIKWRLFLLSAATACPSRYIQLFLAVKSYLNMAMPTPITGRQAAQRPSAFNPPRVFFVEDGRISVSSASDASGLPHEAGTHHPHCGA